jgi:hypothetical protein
VELRCLTCSLGGPPRDSTQIVGILSLRFRLLLCSQAGHRPGREQSSLNQKF